MAMGDNSIPLLLDHHMDGMAGDMGGGMPVGLGDLDVDDVDLFGGAVVDLEIPAHMAPHLAAHPPPSKALQLRVDEQRTRGCCQRIGWSRQGTIASIAADGHSIELRYLRTHPDDGSWGLSEPSLYAQFNFGNTPTVLSGGPLVHVAWATGHPDLAVIDAAGRISILAFPMSPNRPYPLRELDRDPVDDLNAVVGCSWLPVMPPNKQYNILYGPATREADGTYRYETTPTMAFGPNPPNPGKSALVCVTAGGRLRLLFTQNSNAIHDTSIELEGVTTADDLATHAAIANEKGTLLIAMTTAAGQLKVVRAAITWNTTPPQQQQQQQQQQDNKQQQQQLNPVMQHKAAAVTAWLQYGTLEAGSGGQDAQFNLSCAQMSLIEVLPSALLPQASPGSGQSPQQTWAPPVILTVRTYIPTPSTAVYTPETRTILDRWELVVDAPPPALHPAFAQLGFRPPESGANNGSGSTSTTRLQRLAPIVLMGKVVVSVSTMHHGRVVCLVCSDGTVQYRDRYTMEEVFAEPNLAHMASLQQAQFRFGRVGACVAAAVSPTNCSLVTMTEDGRVKWHSLLYEGPEDDDESCAAAVAGLTMAISTASYNQIVYDDILSLARPFVERRPVFARAWVREIVRLLKINVDYSGESHHEQLVRNHPLSLTLSVMNHLGFRGEGRRRAFGGKFARLALNVRNIVVLITIASNTPVNVRVNPLDEPDVVDALAGCTKWALDLLAYLADALFWLRDDADFLEHLTGEKPFAEMAAYLEERNIVALHLVLCSSTRGFLSAACRRLVHLESISTRATRYYEQQQYTQQAQQAQQQQPPAGTAAARRPALIQSYQKMQQYTTSSLVKVHEFGKMLAALNEDIRQTYHGLAAQAESPESAKRQQAQSEVDLLLGENPPAAFQPLLLRFVRDTVQALRLTTDPANLYFADYSLLEVADDDDYTLQQQAQARHAGTPAQYVDVFRRVLIEAPPDADMAATTLTLPMPVMPPAAQNPGRTGLWRRCVRCTAVMEDMAGVRPGYTFVLAQQRKCSCNGNWALLPQGAPVR